MFDLFDFNLFKMEPFYFMFDLFDFNLIKMEPFYFMFDLIHFNLFKNYYFTLCLSRRNCQFDVHRYSTSDGSYAKRQLVLVIIIK
jgi:hypothetical protein